MSEFTCMNCEKKLTDEELGQGLVICNDCGEKEVEAAKPKLEEDSKMSKSEIRHEASPRGSSGGTQGLPDAYHRSMIPLSLMEEIFDAIEGKAKNVQKVL